MVDKVRINDLARELEVKSRAILDVLPQVGVTEKKTHSSSISVEEAEKVKAHFRQGGGDGAGSRSASRRPIDDEPKPKFDFSHISKPGDALKAILEKQHAPAAPPRAAAPVTPPKPIAPVRPASAVTTPQAPVATKPAAPVAEPPAAPKAPAVPPAPVATSPVAPVEEPIDRIEAETETKSELSAIPTTSAPRFITPQPRQAPRIVMPQPPAPPAPVEAEPDAPIAVEPEAPVAPQQPAAAAPPEPRAPQKPVAPQPPPRRLIVPQTGPRPVYTAPIRPPSQTPIAQRPMAGGNRPM